MNPLWPTPEMETAVTGRMEEAVTRYPGDGLQLLLEARRERVVRLAEGEIHQSVDRRTLRLIVTALEERRRGVVATGILTPEEILLAVGRARRIATLVPPDPEYPGLPGPPKEAPAPDRYDEATAGATANELIRVAAAGLEAAQREGTLSAGALRVRESLMIARNSEHLATRSASTRADLSLTCFAAAHGVRSSGYANRFSWRLADLDPQEAASFAAGKARAGLTRRPMTTGFWTAVLEPAAVADLLALLARIGFGAVEVREQRSFASGRLGQEVLDEKLTLRDDPTHPQAAAPCIDYEGVPVRPLALVERGRLKAVATNHRTGHMDGHPSNGHAADPLEGGSETQFLHLALDPGALTREDLIRRVERGILVSRLWYARVVQMREARITALTRDGLLTIENGEIAGGAENFRVNLSLVDLLSRVAALSGPAVPSHGVAAPALLVEGFPLTSPSA